jgi:hypothetical protein
MTRELSGGQWKKLKLFALGTTDITLSKLERNAERWSSAARESSQWPSQETLR